MGFILLGVGIGSFESLQASLIYMILYMVMSVCVCVFGAFIFTINEGDHNGC